jgi:hypothetical protein
MMDKQDKIFLGLMGAAFVAFLLCVHKAANVGPTANAETVIDTPDTEIVGMSLSTRPDPGNLKYSPFKGRLLLPPPLSSLLPSVTADAIQGVSNSATLDGG